MAAAGSTPALIALAERLDLRRVATRDIRHFATVRTRNGQALELVVNPTVPDRT